MNKDQNTTREENIKIIEELYPADSEYAQASQIGTSLLLEAIARIGWRELPTSIITEYAELCLKENLAQRGVPPELRTSFVGDDALPV